MAAAQKWPRLTFSHGRTQRPNEPRVPVVATPTKTTVSSAQPVRRSLLRSAASLGAGYRVIWNCDPA